jgi:hypothetical protein
MADSEGTFGGNGSVFWRIDCDHLKGPVTTEDANGRHKHQGHCGTAPGTRFEVTIKHPAGDGADAETTRVARELREAATALEGGGDGTFTLRVEYGHHGQITVGWDTADEDFVPSFPAA